MFILIEKRTGKYETPACGYTSIDWNAHGGFVMEIPHLRSE